MDALGVANPEKKWMSKGMKFLMDAPSLFNTALRMAPIVNKMPRPLIYNRLNAWGEARDLPKFARESFNDWWKRTHKTK